MKKIKNNIAKRISYRCVSVSQLCIFNFYKEGDFSCYNLDKKSDCFNIDSMLFYIKKNNLY